MQAHILRTPLKEHKRIPLGERYCFKCRKRRNFTDVIMVPTDPMSYYGASAKVVCDTCGTKDADVFPSWERQTPQEG